MTSTDPLSRPTDTREVLPRSRPSEQRVDATGIDALLDAVAAANIELHSLMVLRHGRVIAEGWWAPYTADRRQLLYSLSKSFTSTAVGLAVADGLLSVEDPVLQHLGEFAPDGAAPRDSATHNATHDGTPDELDEKYSRLLVRHALSMATGHEQDTIEAVRQSVAATGAREWLRPFFRLPPEREPGTVFAYNQLATYTVGRIVEKVTGGHLLDFLQPRLFDALGIHEAQTMEIDGHAMAFSGLHLRTASIAAFGQLVLQDGRWGEQQLVPAEWFEQATSLQMANDGAHLADGVDDPDSDGQQGYGFQFWRSRHGFRADGAYGQFCIVWPQEDAVIVTTAETLETQQLLTLIAEHLRPAMAAGVPLADPDVEQQLADRLSALALPVPAVDGCDDPGEPGTDGSFATGSGNEALPGVTSIDLAENPDGGWTLTFHGDTGLPATEPPLTMSVGRGGWVEGSWPPPTGHDPVPFVAAGGWQMDGRFAAELRMIQTPHAFRLELDPAVGEFRAIWRLGPLRADGPSAHALRARPAG